MHKYKGKLDNRSDKETSSQEQYVATYNLAVNVGVTVLRNVAHLIYLRALTTQP